MDSNNFTISTHPFLKRYEGKVDDTDLQKLLRYECFWNWVGHEPNEAELQAISDKLVNDDEDEDDEGSLGSDKDIDSSESKDEPTPCVTKDEEAVDTVNTDSDSTALPVPMTDDDDDIPVLPRKVMFRSLALMYFKKVFWLSQLNRCEEAQSLLQDLEEDLSKRIEFTNNKTLPSEVDKEKIGKFSLYRPEIVDAYNYLLDGLKSFILLQMEDFDNFRTLISGKGVSEFNELGTKGQLLVTYIKLNFFSNGRQYFPQILETYDQLIKLDPEDIDWYKGYHLYARALRRQKLLSSAPDDKETQVAIMAYQLAPSDPACAAICCLNVAEHFRGISNGNGTWPFEYGEITFESSKQMIEFIKARTREVMKKKQLILETEDTQPFINLGTVFQSVLPVEYLDYNIAKECIDCSLQINPNCVVTKHREALLVSKMGKGSTYATKEAEDILREISDHTFHFYGLYDFLNLLLGDVDRNRDELQKLLTNNIQLTQRWNPPEISKLYFLKGCLNFLVRDYREAFDDWIQTLILDSNSEHFEGLTLAANRFHWNKYLLNFKNISRELNNLEKNSFPAEHWHIVAVIVCKVELLLNEEEARYRRRRTRTVSGENGIEQSHSQYRRDKYDQHGSNNWRQGNSGQPDTGRARPSEKSVSGYDQRGGWREGQNQRNTGTVNSFSRRTVSESMADSDDNWRRK